MGACNFIEFKVAKTKEAAFEALVEEAQWEYGHDPYNGTISTTYLSRKPAKVIRKRFTKKAEQEAVNVAEADGWGEKREARAIDCGATKCGHVWAFYGWAAC